MMNRRRALMMAGDLPHIPSGYITNGLVFFLDGKQLVSSTKWKDIVGGNVFNLVNCSVSSNGVVFDGTAYGYRDGTITDNWESETIEIVADLPTFTSGYDVTTIFSQPIISNAMGIGLRFGYDGFYIRTAIAQDGVSRALFEWKQNAGRTRLSCNPERLVVNGRNETNSSTSSYAANNTNRTFLGARATSDPNTTYTRFIGTVYAIRIYSRKLSLAEIQQNQSTDTTYYA